MANFKVEQVKEETEDASTNRCVVSVKTESEESIDRDAWLRTCFKSEEYEDHSGPSQIGIKDMQLDLKSETPRDCGITSKAVGTQGKMVKYYTVKFGNK